MAGNNVCFTSFPRTGNTFLRRFIEQCTGTQTGCDMPLFITAPLQFGGPCAGEGHCANDQVWVTKTHYPMA